jgi:mRNA interferase MazF
VSVERYGVYWVNLDPALGGEIAKTRPAAVVSDEAMNERLGTIVVCPITSRLHPHWPSRVQATVAGGPAEIAVDQIRASVRHVITGMYGVLSISGSE